MAIGKAPLPALLRRHAPRASARPDIRGRKLGHRSRPAPPVDVKKISGLVTPPPPFAEAERKASPTAQHNTVPGRLPTDFQALGASSLNRPAPPWPSGFSSSGRMSLSSSASFHGGLTINRPADVNGPPAVCGATLNSSRRHFPGTLALATASATCLARPSLARRLLTGYHSR